MRYLIWFGMGFNTILYTIYFFMYIFYCPITSPSAVLCQDSLKRYAVAIACINLVSDFYILFIPLTAVWGLQLPPKRKLGIMAIFFTGFL